MYKYVIEFFKSRLQENLQQAMRRLFY